MKKISRGLLVALMLVLTAGISHAQFRIGPRVGINVNKIHTSDYKEILEGSNRCGFTGGVMAEFTLPIVGVGMDASLMYARMNSTIAGTGNSTSKNFFEVPINVKYKLGLPIVGKIISPFIYTGPSFAFRLGKNDSSLKQKTFQWAWNIGLGVELIRHLQIGAGYGFGINSIIEKSGLVDETTKDIKAKNNYWTITAAYLF